MKLKEMLGNKIIGMYTSYLNTYREKSGIYRLGTGDIEVHLLDTDTRDEHFVLLQQEQDSKGDDYFLVSYASTPFTSNFTTNKDLKPNEFTYHIRDECFSLFDDVKELALYRYETTPPDKCNTIILKTKRHAMKITAMVGLNYVEIGWKDHLLEISVAHEEC
ncbi:hypothetical protein FLK61_39475 [Paenalkalicoccus suaedae]|uniref:Uncharacterized protein n=1 Tax=Paenalkalicoccus suaedae TaxID=2592382 RepID=A0A859FHU2_9BACI|nr:hypothetical protein [Paenalkalicoccus suaedae]QKS72697.1 hypothetical protein FLK61_39475 [Paenalkalicoccus suaedae]